MRSMLIKYSPGVVAIDEAFRELRSDVDGDWIMARNHTLAVLGTSGCINTEIVEFNGKITKLLFNTVREGDVALTEEVRVVIHSYEEGGWKVVFDETFPLKTPSIEFDVNAVVRNYTYIAVCPHVRAAIGEVAWYISLPLVYYEPIQPPKAEIDKTYSALYIDGEWRSPGTYRIRKGTEVWYRARAKNVGGRGEVFISIEDARTGKVIDEYHGERETGEYVGISGSFVLESDMDIRFRAGHWNGENWVEDDSHG